MNRALLNVVVIVTLSAAFAARAQPPAPSPEPDERPAPASGSPPSARPPTAARIGLEIVGGAAGVTLAWVPMLTTVGEHGEDGIGNAIFGFFASVAIAPATTAFGVYAAGEVMGGDGNYWPTLGGAFLGLALSVGGAVAGLNLTRDPESEEPDVERLTSGPWVAALSVLPVVGAMIGYDLSDNADHRTATHRTAAAARLLILPDVTPTPDMKGATAGISGRF